MKNNEYGKPFFNILKGALLALAISLFCSVLFAAVLKATNLSQKVVYPVVQIIKNVSVLIGVLAVVRGEKGWLQGVSVASLSTAFSYLTFAAIGGDFSLSWLIFIEFSLTILTGGLGGALAVNKKGV